MMRRNRVSIEHDFDDLMEMMEKRMVELNAIMSGINYIFEDLKNFKNINREEVKDDNKNMW